MTFGSYLRAALIGMIPLFVLAAALLVFRPSAQASPPPPMPAGSDEFFDCLTKLGSDQSGINACPRPASDAAASPRSNPQ
jgi:hypothetical protein